MVSPTAKMQATHWKSLSGLDGSDKTFLERVRAPDAKFPVLLLTLGFAIPIGFGLLMIPIMVLPLLTEAILGSQSPLTRILYAVSSYGLNFLTFGLVLSFLGINGLRVYVALKLRKGKKDRKAG